MEFSWPIGMPLVRSLGRELWDCMEGDRMVLLYGFVKKTQKTPLHELELALRRRRGQANEK